MDPILVQAIRQMLVAQRQAPGKGITLTPDDLEAFMRETTKGKYGYDDATKYLKSINTDIGPRNMARSATQGALFNLGDEALDALTTPGGQAGLSMIPGAGAAAAGLGKLLTPILGENAGEDMRLREDLFHMAHPLADAVGGVAGGVASSLLLPGSGAAATVGKGMLKGAAYGAGYGALSGVGAGEGTADRLERGAVGAGFGAGIGAAIPGAVGLYRGLRNPAAIAQGKISEGISNSGGVDPLLQELERMKRLGRGDVAVPSDLSPHMNDVADFAANVSPVARIPLRNIHDARQADVPTRLLQDTQGALDQAGLPPNANAEARGAELKTQTRAFADSPQGYAGIEAADPKFDLSEFQKALTQPTVKNAWKQARLAGDLTTEDPVDQLLQMITKSNPGLSKAEAQAAADAVRGSAIQDAAKQGIPLDAGIKVPTDRPVSFSDLQQLEQALGDKSSEAWAKGKGALGQAYGTLQDAVTKAMTKSVPNYPEVAAGYAAHKDLERLVQEGAEWWSRSDSRLLGDRVQQLSSDPQRLTEFRTGIASELLKQLDNARANPTILNTLQSAGAALQRKLMTIFGSKDIFDQYMEKVALEKKMGRLGEVVGGSPTSRREAGRDAADAAAGLIHGPATALTAGAHLASKVMKKTAQRQAGAEMGPFFATQGAPDIEKLLRGWSDQTPALLSPFAAKASRALTYGGLKAGGSLFNMF